MFSPPFSLPYQETNEENFLFDSSSDLWIPSSDCTSPACLGRKSYNSTASTSSNLVQGASLSILYGDGSSTSGLVYTDTVTGSFLLIQFFMRRY